MFALVKKKNSHNFPRSRLQLFLTFLVLYIAFSRGGLEAESHERTFSPLLLWNTATLYIHISLTFGNHFILVRVVVNPEHISETLVGLMVVWWVEHWLCTAWVEHWCVIEPHAHAHAIRGLFLGGGWKPGKHLHLYHLADAFI